MIDNNMRCWCELCPTWYFVDLDGTGPWDGLIPCPCGRSHRLCIQCTSRLDLLDDGEWGRKGTVSLKQCPMTDEFQVGLALLGPGEAVKPRPRGER